jgi:hypothetical protein
MSSGERGVGGSRLVTPGPSLSPAGSTPMPGNPQRTNMGHVQCHAQSVGIGIARQSSIRRVQAIHGRPSGWGLLHPRCQLAEPALACVIAPRLTPTCSGPWLWSIAVLEAPTGIAKRAAPRSLECDLFATLNNLGLGWVRIGGQPMTSAPSAPPSFLPQSGVLNRKH